jgi:hypothetical protein
MTTFLDHKPPPTLIGFFKEAHHFQRAAPGLRGKLLILWGLSAESSQ